MAQSYRRKSENQTVISRSSLDIDLTSLSSFTKTSITIPVQRVVIRWYEGKVPLMLPNP